MKPPMMLVHCTLILVSVLFGLSYVLTKEILAVVPAQAWVFYRMLCATLLLLPFALLSRQAWPQRKTWGWLALAATVGMFGNQILFTEGLDRTTPEHSAIINAAIPVLTIAIAVLVRQEQLRWSKVAAVVISMSGVLYLLEADQLLSQNDFTSDTLNGDLLTISNALSFSIFLVIMRHLGQSVQAMTATAFCFILSTTLIAGWSYPSWSWESLEPLLSGTTLAAALTVIIGGTVLNYLLNNWALQHVKSSQVVLYIYFQPLVAVAFAGILGYEAPGPRFWLAGALIAGGVLLESWAKRRRDRRLLAS